MDRVRRGRWEQSTRRLYVPSPSTCAATPHPCSRAAELQPHETQSLLQRFARRLALHHAHSGPAAHAGITAALNAATSTQDHGFGITAAALYSTDNMATPSAAAQGMPHPTVAGLKPSAGGLPAFVASADIRAHYLGEIDGMRVRVRVCAVPDVWGALCCVR